MKESIDKIYYVKCYSKETTQLIFFWQPRTLYGNLNLPMKIQVHYPWQGLLANG